MAAFFPGFGAGLGKSFNLDVDAGAGAGAFAGAVPPPAFGGGLPPPGGLPGGPGFGGGPWYGGFGGVPYVPVTPLGALGGVKGDLLVPIVAVGVAFFLLIIIIMAVKAALAWKLSLLSGLVSEKGHKFRRDTNTTPGPPEEDQLNHLASMVLSAIQSQSCAQNMICQIGTYARTQQGLPSLLRILETVMPKSVVEPLQILRSSAEGSVNCDVQYKCTSDTVPKGSTTTTPRPRPGSNENNNI